MSKIYLIKASGNNTTNDAYLIDNLGNLNWNVETPVTPMPLPEDSHEENILVKMEGNTAKMDLSWTLTEGRHFGTINMGTYAFTPVADDESVFVQIKKWKAFVPISIGDKFIVLVTSDTDDEELIDEGTISNMSFSVSGSSPVVWNVTCSFYVGNVVAVLEADIPNAPTEVKFDKQLTQGSGNPNDANNRYTISYTYTAYDGYATQPQSGDDNFVIGHIIKYKKNNGSWEEVTRTTAQGSFDIIDQSAGTYKLRLAERNGNSSDAATYYWKNATQVGATNTSLVLI